MLHKLFSLKFPWHPWFLGNREDFSVQIQFGVFLYKKQMAVEPLLTLFLVDVSQAWTRSSSRKCWNISVESYGNLMDKPQGCVIFLVHFSHLPLSGFRKFYFLCKESTIPCLLGMILTWFMRFPVLASFNIIQYVQENIGFPLKIVLLSGWVFMNATVSRNLLQQGAPCFTRVSHSLRVKDNFSGRQVIAGILQNVLKG